MKFCLECGTELTLDYEHKKLVCENCKKEYEYLDDINEKEYMCLSCDVDFISDKPTLEVCPYCNSKNITIIKLKKNMKIDNYIPFNIGKKQFIKRYKEKLRSKIFVPNKFYKSSIIKTANNVYLPYYLCDMHAKGRLLFNADKEVLWMSNSYKYQKIDDYQLYRFCESDIKETTIFCSDKMDRIKVDNIMPYKYDEIIKYQNNELKDYIYEECSNRLNKDKIRDKVEELFIKNAFSKIKDYNKVELVKVETAANNFKYQKVLLPIWILNIEYKNKMYYFIMNGQTGKIYYDFPRSKVKMFVMYIVMFIIIFFILVLLRGIL